MVTNRTPRKRAKEAIITPEALEIYRRIRVLRCQCPPPRGTDMEVHWDDICQNCHDWWHGMARICDLLHLKPWIWPCLPKLGQRWRDPDSGELVLYEAEPHQYALEKRFEDILVSDRTTVRARRKKEVSTDVSTDRGTTADNPTPEPAPPTPPAR